MDARFPERWLNDRRIMRLSPSAFRSFVCALAWAVSNRTDGMLDGDDLQLIPGFLAVDIGELMAKELVESVDGGFVLVDFNTTQTSADEITRLERIRKAEREKKAAQRAKKRLNQFDAVPGDMSRGQHRLGQASREEEVQPSRHCDEHMPHGTRDRCGDCARARAIADEWKRARPTVSGLVTADEDPATCTHQNGAGRSTIAAGACSLCGTLVALEAATA